MTCFQRQLIETYENSGYSAALDFWKENAERIEKLSKNEISILKNMMKRYCLINNDSKTAEIILSGKKEQNIDNKKITKSLFKLGKLYYTNAAPERNIIKAEELYTLAAEQGSVDDMYKLANMYKTGDCVQKNYEKAFFWLEKVALTGNKIAQFELGEMYMQGKGVTKSKEEAIKWYKASNDAPNSYSRDLSTMIIPDGITRIEESAFEGFENLVKVIIPESIQGIGNYAFKNCINLKEMYLPNDSIGIGIDTFENCTSLSEESSNSIRNCNFKLIKMDSRSFYICKYEVTQDIYEKIMGENPSHFKGCRRPVECVSYYDVVYFCNKLSLKEGLNPVYSVNGEYDVSLWDYKPHIGDSINGSLIQNRNVNGYRLPTKNEWEYAVNGGKNFKYSDSDILDEVGWYAENSSDETHEVGQKLPNDFGLYDMNGNVWEWCHGGVIEGGGYSDKISINGNFYSKRFQTHIVNGTSIKPFEVYCELGFRLARSAS